MIWLITPHLQQGEHRKD